MLFEKKIDKKAAALTRVSQLCCRIAVTKKKQRIYTAMIKNKTQIINEMKEEINKIFDKYGDDMESESNKKKFPIDLIESMLGNIIADSKKVIVDKTEELINNIDESEEINKKNRILRGEGDKNTNIQKQCRKRDINVAWKTRPEKESAVFEGKQRDGHTI
jgi:dsRNA-specific ribonuclease